MDMTVALLLPAPVYLGMGEQIVQISTCDCAQWCCSKLLTATAIGYRPAAIEEQGRMPW
jgi:hypothetical protein